MGEEVRSLEGGRGLGDTLSPSRSTCRSVTGLHMGPLVKDSLGQVAHGRGAGGVHFQDSIVPGLLVSWRSGETKGGLEFSQFSVAFVMMCE